MTNEPTHKLKQGSFNGKPKATLPPFLDETAAFGLPLNDLCVRSKEARSTNDQTFRKSGKGHLKVVGGYRSHRSLGRLPEPETRFLAEQYWDRSDRSNLVFTKHRLGRSGQLDLSWTVPLLPANRPLADQVNPRRGDRPAQLVTRGWGALFVRGKAPVSLS